MSDQSEDIIELLNKHAGTRSDVDAYLHAYAADEIASLRAELTTSRELCTKYEAAVGEDVGEILKLRNQLVKAEANLAAMTHALSIVESQHAAARKAMQGACDLLAERTYGNAARSPGHNARLELEAALTDEEGKSNG